ncbi:PaaI family thioesterase [Methylocapsa sp. S129]|uniref:PaaI family thioesterase n=1 Tax=Methylocapsa sp. S129 TaxID=1641869 RepID=UPI00131A76E2|nr:PaaI family thioesterase [Methylocapsa sp. S129]
MSEQNSTALRTAPGASIATSEEVDGLEFLNRIKDGRWPPPAMAVLLGFDIVETERGRVVFAAIPTAAHYNPAGAVHGGFAATLLDSCMTCAVQSTLKAGLSCTTLDLNIHYTRGANDKTGVLRAEGKVVHVGRQIATAEGRVTDPQGRVIAHATTSCLIFPIRPPNA